MQTCSMHDRELICRTTLRRACLCLCVGLAALTGAGSQPARADMFTPSAKDQIRLGDQAATEIMRKYRIVNDRRAARVEDVGARLVDALPPDERGPWNYRFHLIDSKEVNAFALPGGQMFLFTGLYNRIRTEDELAAVMGHEMTHVRKQHWAHQVAAQQKRGLGLSVLLGLTRAGSTWRTAAGLADTMINLRYSRKDEDQADSGGLQDMVRAGYNPDGMLGLFQILKEAGGGAGGPAWLQDHPLTDTRIEHTRDRINQLPDRVFRPQRSLD